MRVTKIISGGQTGADMAALFAANAMDIPTGGWCPKNYLTEAGPAPWLADFGLEPTHERGYAERTRRNIATSDGTVIFGRLNSLGSALTMALCVTSNKPCLHLDVPFQLPIANRLFDEWLDKYKIETLNVAGNRESVNPGICMLVTEFLQERLG